MESIRQTIVDVFYQTVSAYPRNPAFIFIDKTFSYENYNDLSNRIAHGFIAAGLKKGDRVAIHLPNLPQFLVAMMGALKAGCIFSGVSPLGSADEVEWQLRDLEASALVTYDDAYSEKLREKIHSLASLKLVVVTRPLDLMPRLLRFLARLAKKLPYPKIHFTDKREVWFWDFMKNRQPGKVHVESAPEEVAAILYTGGTTGTPKGAMLTHSNLLTNIAQGRSVTNPLVGVEKGLSIFPFFHIAGLTAALNTIVIAGAWLLVPNPRDLNFIIRQFGKYKPSLIFAVPLLYQKLLEKEKFRTLDFSSLKFVMSGATAMPAALMAELGKLTCCPVIEGYGMTEASPGITVNYPDDIKKGSVGKPLPGTKVKIIDFDSGEELPVGKEGHLIAQGPQVMQGYWRNSAETANVIRNWQGGKWLFTGDVARLDAGGHITIVDRIKDMVNVSGYKVFSAELEDVVGKHAMVKAAAVLAEHQPDSLTEVVRLVVELNPEFFGQNVENLTAELARFCREHVAVYKVPKIIDFIPAMPLTPIGKTDKRKLRQLLSEKGKVK